MTNLIIKIKSKDEIQNNIYIVNMNAQMLFVNTYRLIVAKCGKNTN